MSLGIYRSGLEPQKRTCGAEIIAAIMLITRLRPLRTIRLISKVRTIALIGFGAIGLAGVLAGLAGGQACPFAALQASSERSERDGRRAVTADVDAAPQALLRTPPGADWPSYNGDYTGRR